MQLLSFERKKRVLFVELFSDGGLSVCLAENKCRTDGRTDRLTLPKKWLVHQSTNYLSTIFQLLNILSFIFNCAFCFTLSALCIVTPNGKHPQQFFFQKRKL